MTTDTTTMTRDEIDGAEDALGTGIDLEAQDVHGGDELDGELRIVGNGQLSFELQGKRPTTSSLRLMGGKIDVEGQFNKGATVVVEIECVVGEVAFIDVADKATGQVVGCERRHKARVVGVRPV